jgi:disulfide bond formation protein DsbB
MKAKINIRHFLQTLNAPCLLLFCAGFSLLLLLVALVGQYVFGLHPCELCIYQRIPYVFIVFIGCFGFFFIRSSQILYWLAVFCSLLFLLDAGIAFYHSGVEYGLFPAPTTCSANSSSGQSLEEMREAIRNAPLVNCNQAMLYVLGLSMASWNFIVAFFAFLVSGFIILKKVKKNEKNI